MNDGGGCGQQLVIRQEICFRDHGNIALNIQVFTLIFRQAYCALICRIHPRAVYQLSGTEHCLQGWMRLVAAGTGPRGPPVRGRADRRGGALPAAGPACGSAGRPRRRARLFAAVVRQPHGEGRRPSEPLHAQLAEQG
jgi:hypothetical protein